MASANVDPTELRRFAGDLKRFNEELMALSSGVHGRLRGLENTWRDQENRKFVEQFEGTLKMISAFAEQSQLHVSFLNKKAAAIEAYLKQR